MAWSPQLLAAGLMMGLDLIIDQIGRAGKGLIRQRGSRGEQGIRGSRRRR
jgi:hypothetical protein